MRRMIVIQAVQLPLLGLLYWGKPPASLWLAGVIGSVICCYGTDSNWRWRNRAPGRAGRALAVRPFAFR